MTTLREARSAPAGDIDLARWPGMRAPRSAPLRAAAARTLLRRITERTGIQVKLADGTSMGERDRPVLEVRDDSAFFTRLGRDG
jgi:cyclopropane-fatty-acyl-phospholipid synthase